MKKRVKYVKKPAVDLAAPAYERLLATTYDFLKAENPNINVIGGALSPRGGDNAVGAAPDPFADDVHPRPRQDVPRERPDDADHGRLRDAPVSREVGAAAVDRAPEVDDDRLRGLPEAREDAQGGVQRDGAARRDAADRLRRVRRPDEDPARKGRRVQQPRHEGRAGRRERGDAGRLLPPGADAGVLPAERRRPAGLPRLRRGQRKRLAVGPLLRRRHAEGEPQGRARGSRGGGRGNALELLEREGPDVPRVGHASAEGSVRARQHVVGRRPHVQEVVHVRRAPRGVPVREAGLHDEGRRRAGDVRAGRLPARRSSRSASTGWSCASGPTASSARRS